MHNAILHKPLHFQEEIHVSQVGRDILSFCRKFLISENSNILNVIWHCVIAQLLQKEQHVRLGSIQEDISQHPFFSQLNWDDLVQPPFRSELSDAYDLHNIDPEFTRDSVATS